MSVKTRYCELCGRRLGKVREYVTQCSVCAIRHPYNVLCPNCPGTIHVAPNHHKLTYKESKALLREEEQ